MTKTPPKLNVHPSYIDYLRARQSDVHQPVASLQSYLRAATETRGAPIPFGEKKGDEGYEEEHPEESDLPKDDEGNRAVFGVHEGKALEGPVHWQEYYRRWPDLGPRQQIPDDRPITTLEEVYCQEKGIQFHENRGGGSYGTVWRCTREGKELACKVIDVWDYQRPDIDLHDSITNMLRESDVLNGLAHKNIVAIEHIFHIHDERSGFPLSRMLLFMELCDGDLNSELRAKSSAYSGQKFSEAEAKPVMIDVCKGLKYLHQNNVIHLDLKPHNILHTKDQTSGQKCYKLTDFGISLRFPPGVAPLIGKARSTFGYRAPEMDDPNETNGLAADIYMLGMTLLHMLVGMFQFLDCHKELWQTRVPRNHLQQVARKYGLSMEAINLTRSMTNEGPNYRPTLDTVMANPWFGGIARFAEE